MKKILTLLAIIIAGFTMANASDTYTRDASALPAAARTLIANDFSAGISIVKIDKTMGRVDDYEVVLTDGTEIKFDRNGNWEEVEVAANKRVPDALIPAGIRNYVSDNQHGTRIVGIEKSRKGYEVTLSNGVEIKFNREGQFIRFDR